MSPQAQSTSVVEENQHALKQLLELVNRAGIIPFVGAGMSAGFYPGWASFLLQEAAQVGINDKVQALLRERQYEEAAEELSSELGEQAFVDTIQKRFSPEKLVGSEIGGAVALLPAFAKGPVLTLNFDCVLENVFERAGLPFERIVCGTAEIDQFKKALELNRHYLLKVHGDVADSTHRVLTLQEYRRHYGDAEHPAKPSPLHLLLERVAMFGRLLFLGCSLTQDRFMEILKSHFDRYHERVGFALVQKPPEQELFRKRLKFLSSYGLTPIWYPEGEYKAVQLLLEYLVGQLSSGPRDGGGFGELRDRVESLIQRHTGPFAGREAEIGYLNTCAACKPPESVLITGEAGLGKTALLARWVLERKKKNECTAYHFFSQRSGVTAVTDAYVNILRQLFRYGVAAKHQLPGREDEEKLRAILYEVLKQWPDSAAPLAIVFDAMDEAEKPIPPFPNLTTSVCFIVSARAGENEELEYVRGWRENCRPLHLGRLDRPAIESWVRQADGSELLSQVLTPEFVATLENSTQGLPLYLHYLIDELVQAAKDGEDLPAVLKNTPTGFTAYVREQVKLLASHPDRRTFEGLLAVLAVAVAPLPEGDIEQLTGLGVFDLYGLPWTINRWFTRRSLGSGEVTYAFAHPLLAAEFDKVLGGLTQTARQKLVDYCESWQKNRSPYALEHFSDILFRFKRWNELFALARSSEYAAAQRSAFPNQPALPLRTLRYAIEAAAIIDDPICMGEFTLRHARELARMATKESSPLAALRQGSLERAKEIAHLSGRGERALWLLLLAWELKDCGRKEAALTTIRSILADAGMLYGWEHKCGCRLLPFILDLNPELFNELRQRLLMSDGERGIASDVLTNVRLMAEELAKKGHFVAALETLRELPHANGRTASVIGYWQAFSGDLEGAARTLDVIAKPRYKAEAYASIGLALARVGKKTEAAEQFELARECALECASGILTDHEIRPAVQREALREIGVRQAQAGMVEEALTTVQEMTEISTAAMKQFMAEADDLEQQEMNFLEPSQEELFSKTEKRRQSALHAARAMRSQDAMAEVLAELAVAVAQAGCKPDECLRRAEKHARESDSYYGRSIYFSALRQVAGAWARAGRKAEACSILSEVRDEIEKEREYGMRLELEELVLAFAQIGEYKAALEIVENLQHYQVTHAPAESIAIHRATLITKIAVVRAQSGEIGEAVDMLRNLPEEASYRVREALIDIAAIQSETAPVHARDLFAEAILTATPQVAIGESVADALGEIALAQVRAEDLIGSIATVQGSWPLASRAYAIADVAIGHAEARNFDAALNLADSIGATNAVKRNEVLQGIVAQMARAGECARALDLAAKIGNAYIQNGGYADVAKVLAERGELIAARDTLARINVNRAPKENYCRSLASIAVAEAKSGQPSEAVKTAFSISELEMLAEAVRGIARICVRDDPSGAAEQLKQDVIACSGFAWMDGRDGTRSLAPVTSAQKTKELVRALSEIARVQAQSGLQRAAGATLSDVANLLTYIDDNERSGLLVAVGLAQWAAGWTREAQTSFDAALGLAPDDKEGSVIYKIICGLAEMGEFETGFGYLRQVKSPYGRANTLAGIASPAVPAAFGEWVIRVGEEIWERREAWIPELAGTLVKARDKVHFKQLLLPSAQYVTAAFQICGSLATLYPESASGLVQLVREFSQGLNMVIGDRVV